MKIKVFQNYGNLVVMRVSHKSEFQSDLVYQNNRKMLNQIKFNVNKKLSKNLNFDTAKIIGT